jgi:hypothetical protein
MIFRDAYMKMLEGKKIKRPCFVGFWYLDGKEGDLKIHLENGEEINSGNLRHTVMNCLAHDWEVVEE